MCQPLAGTAANIVCETLLCSLVRHCTNTAILHWANVNSIHSANVTPTINQRWPKYQSTLAQRCPNIQPTLVQRSQTIRQRCVNITPTLFQCVPNIQKRHSYIFIMQLFILFQICYQSAQNQSHVPKNKNWAFHMFRKRRRNALSWCKKLFHCDNISKIMLVLM